jgi:pyruvate dehydrogenase E2 component (dihydrolipoamide acetyltransferase)
MTAVTVPQLSISMEEAKVSRWLVEDGEPVRAGQLLVEVETDKATVEIEAPAAGVLRIVAAEGAIVPVEGVLAELDDGNGPTPSAGRAVTEPEPLSPAWSDANGASVAGGQARAGLIASPAARRLARERGVDIATVAGTGPGGRIVARDVGAAPVPSAGTAAPAPAPLGGDPAPVARDRLREAVVANITASWQQIPHVHIGGELAADGLVQARSAAAPPEGGLTVTDLLVVALARALVDVPELNGLRRSDGSVERDGAVHLSLAVASADGVVAPVIRDAGSRTLAEVTQERRRLVAAARQGTLEGRDLVGGTCTLSNLGAYPVDFFAPVVSGPQVAMIATGRVVERVVADSGWVGVRPRMWVNVAIDHRAADGEAGGRLLAALERQIALLPGGPA